VFPVVSRQTESGDLWKSLWKRQLDLQADLALGIVATFRDKTAGHWQVADKKELEICGNLAGSALACWNRRLRKLLILHRFAAGSFAKSY
jgi:uncharacterized protein YhdP